MAYIILRLLFPTIAPVHRGAFQKVSEEEKVFLAVGQSPTAKNQLGVFQMS
jgi:hypothetical protein